MDRGIQRASICRQPHLPEPVRKDRAIPGTHVDIYPVQPCISNVAKVIHKLEYVCVWSTSMLVHMHVFHWVCALGAFCGSAALILFMHPEFPACDTNVTRIGTIAVTHAPTTNIN